MLDQLEKAAREATPGKRRYDRNLGCKDIFVRVRIRRKNTLLASTPGARDPQDKYDARFIAACDRETILALIARVREAEGQWLQGYACAVGALARMEGSRPGIHDTRVQELIGAGGLTVKACRKDKVDDYDMEALFTKEELEAK